MTDPRIPTPDELAGSLKDSGAIRAYCKALEARESEINVTKVGICPACKGGISSWRRHFRDWYRCRECGAYWPPNLGRDLFRRAYMSSNGVYPSDGERYRAIYKDHKDCTRTDLGVLTYTGRSYGKCDFCRSTEGTLEFEGPDGTTAICVHCFAGRTYVVRCLP